MLYRIKSTAACLSTAYEVTIYVFDVLWFERIDSYLIYSTSAVQL